MTRLKIRSISGVTLLPRPSLTILGRPQFGLVRFASLTTASRVGVIRQQGVLAHAPLPVAPEKPVHRLLGDTVALHYAFDDFPSGSALKQACVANCLCQHIPGRIALLLVT